MRTFRKGCAPSNLVRTFARALPWTRLRLTRRGAQPLGSASFVVFGQVSFGSCVHCPLSGQLNSGRAMLGRETLRLRQVAFLPQALTHWAGSSPCGSAIRAISEQRGDFRAKARSETKRAAPWIRHGSASARLTACGCTVVLFASPIMPEVMSWLKINPFEERARESPAHCWCDRQQ
jgi:hypothetical protein